jgi:hypothetical protein
MSSSCCNNADTVLYEGHDICTGCGAVLASGIVGFEVRRGDDAPGLRRRVIAMEPDFGSMRPPGHRRAPRRKPIRVSMARRLRLADEARCALKSRPRHTSAPYKRACKCISLFCVVLYHLLSLASGHPLFETMNVLGTVAVAATSYHVIRPISTHGTIFTIDAHERIRL